MGMKNPLGDVYVHQNALNESEYVGSGTRIWAFAHVMSEAVVGKNCNIGDHVFVEGGAVIGDGVTLKNGVCVWEGVTLEDYVFVGPNAVFTNDMYPRSPRGPGANQRYANKDWLVATRIKEGASLGANCTIRCGVTIGSYAMVAAGAVVLDDVGDFALMAGCPARRIGHVCMCGQKLGSGDAPKCKTCGRRYGRTGRDVRNTLALRTCAC